MPPDLLVEGDLEVDAEGVPVRVVGDGDRVLVRLPSLAAAREFRRGPALAVLARVLSSTGLRADVAIDGVRVATLDPEDRPGWLASVLGVAPARPDLVGLLRVLTTRR